ncbi:MerC domain-containing protein [Pedobacter rhizosphaerae]|uniref:MerC mercury resistance protein n=1 Tax=Pedobacter rhizosphaerae TaxID=390241 RepID=A0A1H9MNR4_9SPHI|nr:MerC domain-containing protein [Pedobacter rhizosphaerae]SER25221.1 MerC mercury resistance protein [Pedobacter rhizosphaerae]
MNILKLNLDKIGISASVLCAIHCAAVPFVITLLPLWGLDFIANEWFEIGMICLSLLLGIWSLGKSIKSHRQFRPLLLLILGFLSIAFGHFSGISVTEPILIPLGGLMIAAAHLINLKYLKKCPVNNNHQH